MVKSKSTFGPGTRLRAARLSKGLTQMDLQTRTGVKQSALSEFESGASRDMDASSLVKLCVEIGTTAEHVMLGERSAHDATEAEAVALLRGTSNEVLRAAAMNALRAILAAATSAQPRKRAVGDGG